METKTLIHSQLNVSIKRQLQTLLLEAALQTRTVTTDIPSAGCHICELKEDFKWRNFGRQI